MAEDDFKPKLGRTRDAGRGRLVKHTTRVFRQAGNAGVRALRQKGHVPPSALKRGMGTGVRAAAGLIAPGSRRVIVKARYTRIVGGDLGAARAHLKYVMRDGATRDGLPGHLYDATHDEADGSAFLDRSGQDPHQFRFIVSPEDSARLADLKPFIRDLLSQMERDLETKLDWVAVDHFNTGHPHTHIVIRGRDDQARDLIMARDYIAHGVRARAQGLITLELGPETDLERTQKLFNETGQERLTRLDRSLLARAKDGILVVTSAEEQDPVQQTLRIGRLKTLERLGLAQERQQGVWQLDGKLESKLRRLGERADKFRTMQQVLRELGIDRAAAAIALFERGPRKVPLIGKVIGSAWSTRSPTAPGWWSMPLTAGCTTPTWVGSSPPTCRIGACWWRLPATRRCAGSLRPSRGWRSCPRCRSAVSPRTTGPPGSTKPSLAGSTCSRTRQASPPSCVRCSPTAAAGSLPAAWPRCPARTRSRRSRT
jgi:type IV secretory pathway VirD2 relaxase